MKQFITIFVVLTVMAVSVANAQEICRITNYSPEECPNRFTASGVEPSEERRCAAVSRDIERRYKLKFGDRITIPGLGVFTFLDRTARYLRKTIDIYENHKSHALQFGVKWKVVEFK